MNSLLKKILFPVFKLLRGRECTAELVSRGLVIGKNVKISGVIDPSHCWLIEIGDNVFIAEGALLLAHDPSAIQNDAARIGRITIGNRTFIGARSVVLPNVKIGNNVVIGAGSVVTRDIPDNVIAAGNPCKVIGDRMKNEEKHKADLLVKPTWPWPEYAIEGGITDEQKKQMKNDLENTYGYLINH